ncbi:MAG: ferrochelatase [Planctomycetes bacterium]|nr:ferrochelatase [Planctomycetota bacterium]
MVGVLLIQLGTPDAPTPEALRPYLRQFLGDPRVIEAPPWYWPIIFQFILWTRPAQSAAKYARIWDKVTGSPLMHWTKRQTELLQAKFPNMPVRFGMQVGNPPVAKVVDEMIRAGVDRLIVFPMYPQYSATTTASATDVLFKCLLDQRCVPALRIVPPYYEHPAYLAAMANVITDELAKLPWKPDHHVLSFHGLPVRYAESGDPYPKHVERTTQGVIAKLGWPRDAWTQSYQSLFGKEEWLRPYTDDVLTDLAKQGKKKVFVALPGFTVDCLETVDEIGNESRETFLHAGGEILHPCPCLNDHPSWIEAMRTIILEEGQGWL